MAYKLEATIADVFKILEVRAKTTLRENDANKQAYDALIAAQNGETVLAWSRRLFELAETGPAQAPLTVVASDFTLECTPGHALFTGFVAGRDVQITGFGVNAGNNQTTEVTSVVNLDKIHIGNATGLVDETDQTARAQMNPYQAEQDITQDVVDAMTSINSVYTCVDSISTDLTAFVL